MSSWANRIDFGFEKKSIEVSNRGVFLSVGIHKVGERFGKFQSHRWRREAIERLVDTGV